MRDLRHLLPLLFVIGCTAQSAEEASVHEHGPDARLAEGPVVSYATFDATGTPTAIGVSISAKAMDTLPAEMSDGHQCFDRNGDGAIDRDTECHHMHERAMPLPSKAANRADIPFKWVLFNWNPMGHLPPGIYDTPHFDVHFMIEPIESIYSIDSGPCGPDFVRCDQFEIARKPVPAEYVAADYQNFDAIVPAMGNHLLDVKAPELHGAPFTRTWIYGAYDGRITFYEEMVTVDYLKSRPDTCHAIKQPAAVAVDGFYPTQSCLRYNATDEAYTVSMESFVYRDATAAAAAEPAADDPMAAMH